MKITLDDFNYRGHHFKRVECEIPQVDELEEALLEDLLSMYLMWDLDDFINFNESFDVKEKSF